MGTRCVALVMVWMRWSEKEVEVCRKTYGFDKGRLCCCAHNNLHYFTSFCSHSSHNCASAFHIVVTQNDDLADFDLGYAAY